jgi:hypothetical protein
VKAHLLAFFSVNQAVILAGYWWANLLHTEVFRLAAVLALPAIVGMVAGVAAFSRIDAARFRQIVFGVLFVSGAAVASRLTRALPDRAGATPVQSRPMSALIEARGLVKHLGDAGSSTAWTSPARGTDPRPARAQRAGKRRR